MFREGVNLKKRNMELAEEAKQNRAKRESHLLEVEDDGWGKQSRGRRKLAYS